MSLIFRMFLMVKLATKKIWNLVRYRRKCVNGAKYSFKRRKQEHNILYTRRLGTLSPTNKFANEQTKTLNAPLKSPGIRTVGVFLCMFWYTFQRVFTIQHDKTFVDLKSLQLTQHGAQNACEEEAGSLILEKKKHVLKLQLCQNFRLWVKPRPFKFYNSCSAI